MEFKMKPDRVFGIEILVPPHRPGHAGQRHKYGAIDKLEDALVGDVLAGGIKAGFGGYELAEDFFEEAGSENVLAF